MTNKTDAINNDIRRVMQNFKNEKTHPRNGGCLSILNTSKFELKHLPNADGILSGILIPQKSLLKTASAYYENNSFSFKEEYNLLNPAGRFNVLNLGDVIEIESNGFPSARHLITNVYPDFDVAMFMLPYILNLNSELINGEIRYQVRFHYMLPQTKQFGDDDIFLVVLDRKTGNVYTKARLYRAYHALYNGAMFKLDLVPNITLQDLN